MTGDEAISRRGVVTALLAITVVAAAVRFCRISYQCCWFDEIWHAELSTGRGSAHLSLPPDAYVAKLDDLVSLEGAPPIWKIPGHMDRVMHPPLYHILLRVWRTIFGDSVVSLRGMSATLSVLAVLATFDAARQCISQRAALWACLILAISGGQLEQAQEIRGYSLLLFLGLLCFSATCRLTRTQHPIGLSLLVAGLMLAMMWTHYFSLGFCAGLTVWITIATRGRTRTAAAACIFAAATVYLVAWGPTISSQLAVIHESADPWLADSTPHPMLSSLLRLASLPGRSLTAAAHSGTSIVAGLALWMVIVLACGRSPTLLPAILCSAGMILLLLGLDVARRTQHLDFQRYSLVASPMLIMLIIAGVRELTPRGKDVASGICALATAAFLPVGYIRDDPDFRPLAAALATTRPGEPLIIISPEKHGNDGQAIYLWLAYYAGCFPRPAIIATRLIEGETLGQLKHHRAAWIVSVNPEIDPNLVLPGWKVRNYEKFKPFGALIEMENSN